MGKVRMGRILPNVSGADCTIPFCELLRGIYVEHQLECVPLASATASPMKKFASKEKSERPGQESDVSKRLVYFFVIKFSSDNKI
jgi:hypothetical protein